MIEHADAATVRGLGFCVSVEHARFMARSLQLARHQSRLPSGATDPRAEREAALREHLLSAMVESCVLGRVCSMRGSTFRAVDTVLMLRPTESPTLFLQQRWPAGGAAGQDGDGKDAFVLDFRRGQPIAREFRPWTGPLSRAARWPRRAHRAHRGGAVPLSSRRAAACSNSTSKRRLRRRCEVCVKQVTVALAGQEVDEVRSLQRTDPTSDLRTIALNGSGLDLGDVYSGSKSWSGLLDAAGAPARTRRLRRSSRCVEQVTRLLHGRRP